MEPSLEGKYSYHCPEPRPALYFPMDKGFVFILIAIGAIWFFALRDDAGSASSFTGVSELVHIDPGNFQSEVLDSDVPVVANFSAEWCGPCKRIAPTVEYVAVELKGRAKVAKIDVDKNRALSAKYGIRGIPAFLVFKNGEPVGSINRGSVSSMVAAVESYLD